MFATSIGGGAIWCTVMRLRHRLGGKNDSLPLEDDLKSHLRADCLYTRISSRPTLDNENGRTLPLPVPGTDVLSATTHRSSSGPAWFITSNRTGAISTIWPNILTE